MPIYRNEKNKAPDNKKLHSVSLLSLVDLCKTTEEQNQLLDAIAEMELQNQASLTLDTKVRTLSYKTALANAGLSEETIDSIMEQGDLSGLLGNVESQLAESYLRDHLPMGTYVKQADVDVVIKQLQEDTQNTVDKVIAQARFEESMQKLCDNAEKFDSEALANSQIEAGKSSKNYDIYRMDPEGGLCITEVPKAIISANKDQIVAELREQVQKEIKAEQKHANSVGSGAKTFATGDAENMSKGTIQMTAAAAMFIFAKIKEVDKRKALEDAMKQGEVKIQTVVNNLVGLEKSMMVDSMEEDHSVFEDGLNQG